MVLLALGPGEHGVVIGHQHATALAFPKQIAIDSADARDQTIGRGVADEVIRVLD